MNAIFWSFVHGAVLLVITNQQKLSAVHNPKCSNPYRICKCPTQRILLANPNLNLKHFIFHLQFEQDEDKMVDQQDFLLVCLSNIIFMQNSSKMFSCSDKFVVIVET